MPHRPRVAFGFLGSVLDASPAEDPDRWMRWRPSVAVCQHEDFVVDRYELLVLPRNEKLARTVAADIASVSPETTLRLHDFAVADPWDLEAVYGGLYELATAYEFRPEEEDYFVHITTGTHVVQICLFILTESRHFPAKLIQSNPPARRRSGRAGTIRVIDLDLSKYELIANRFEEERSEARTFLKSGIATRNEAFNLLIEEIESVAARSNAPILLQGPTGAGKSHLAKRIYDLKRSQHRVEGRFVEVNCATLRGDAAMSALFGHVRGSFTGATHDRPGLLRQADEGLLFLDEIGELGPDEQAMLLRAIEEKRFLPVGGDEEVESRFQLIAGTNRDLAVEAHEGRFREDLLARIDLWTYRLPGLAERREDIEPNLDYELALFERSSGDRVRFLRDARERFLRFALSDEARWTASFRDLNASVVRMATLAPERRITREVVEREIGRLRTAWMTARAPAAGAGSAEETLARHLPANEIEEIDRFDRAQLAEVLHVCASSKSLSEAGRELFAASRRRKRSSNDADRLRKYLARFGLDWSQLRERG